MKTKEFCKRHTLAVTLIVLGIGFIVMSFAIPEPPPSLEDLDFPSIQIPNATSVDAAIASTGSSNYIIYAYLKRVEDGTDQVYCSTRNLTNGAWGPEYWISELFDFQISTQDMAILRYFRENFPDRIIPEDFTPLGSGRFLPPKIACNGDTALIVYEYVCEEQGAACYHLILGRFAIMNDDGSLNLGRQDEAYPINSLIDFNIGVNATEPQINYTSDGFFCVTYRAGPPVSDTGAKIIAKLVSLDNIADCYRISSSNEADRPYIYESPSYGLPFGDDAPLYKAIVYNPSTNILSIVYCGAGPNDNNMYLKELGVSGNGFINMPPDLQAIHAIPPRTSYTKLLLALGKDGLVIAYERSDLNFNWMIKILRQTGVRSFEELYISDEYRDPTGTPRILDLKGINRKKNLMLIQKECEDFTLPPDNNHVSYTVALSNLKCLIFRDESKEAVPDNPPIECYISTEPGYNCEAKILQIRTWPDIICWAKFNPIAELNNGEMEIHTKGIQPDPDEIKLIRNPILTVTVLDNIATFDWTLDDISKEESVIKHTLYLFRNNDVQIIAPFVENTRNTSVIWRNREDTTYACRAVVVADLGDGTAHMSPITDQFTVGRPVNHRPVILPIGNQSVNENAILTFAIRATDIDGDRLTFLPVQNLPAGAKFDPGIKMGQYSFSWKPTYSQGGRSYRVTFSVSDGNSKASKTITITVQNVNRSPIANAGRDQSVNEGDLVTLDGRASRDPDGDPLSYGWTQRGGQAVDQSVGLNNTLSTQATFTFTAPLVDNPRASLGLEFQLQVSEVSRGLRKVITDNVTIKVWPRDTDGDGTIDRDDQDDDNDGLPDGVETALGTNPRLRDSDNDGISDADEDTDGDGLTNIAEINIHHTSPLTPTYTIKITADNAFELSVNNEQPVGSGNNWMQCYTFFRDLNPGDSLNVTATDSEWKAGLIVEGSIGNNVVFVSDNTDNTWECRTDNSGWGPATGYGFNGVEPWGRINGFSDRCQWIWSADNLNDNIVYFRKRI